MFAAGMPPGEYSFMGHRVALTSGGRVQLAGTPYLAGSSLHLVEGIRNVMAFAGVTLAEAIQMGNQNPRRLLGMATEPNELRPGAPADFLLLRQLGDLQSLSLAATVVAGQLVYQEQSQ
jgi:N-acetylglucosamine-6-phosphate deacetylase